jgi:quercetin dioxygenase-like cupin family protein
MTKNESSKSWFVVPILFGAAAMLMPTGVAAQSKSEFVVEKIAERSIAALPAGELYWTAETFPTLAEAEAAVGDTNLAVEVDGKAWLLTLGPEDDQGHGGEVVASIGPIQRFDAPAYLLRINTSLAPPGSETSTHSHPGSEAIYILSGEVTVRWPDSAVVLAKGESQAGQPPHTPMVATSTGEEDLVELIMFVVDQTQDFARPETMD